MDIQVFLDNKDPIKKFAHWYIKEVIHNKVFHINTIYDNVTSIADCMGIVLFRKYPFQVQIFACKENQKSPEHTHPDVDSYELYFGGDIAFSKNGKTTFKSIQNKNDEISSMWGWFLRVNSDDKHEAITGKNPASFLSIQYWKNNKPMSSVERNWNGQKFGENHIIN